MKNLRKVLALVLVVATLMGFAAMATAAFNDAKDIVNEEAADLLAALKVVEGRPDGSFDPEAIVTRGEMAKMIAVMVTGGKFDAKLYADACEFADTKDHWSAGYVAYCATEGIIDGYPDGTFKPYQKVKVVEAAKMVLAALGYSAEEAGFAGSKWAAKVITVADNRNLLAGIDQLSNEYATRDTAAQMMYNGLQATMVKWNGVKVEVDDTVVNINGKFEDRVAVSVMDPTVTETIELYEDAFGGELVRTPSVGYANAGAFDAPVVQWYYKGEKITETYAKVKATYDVAVSYGEIYKDVCNGIDPKSVVVSIDGVEEIDPVEAVNGLKKKATTSAAKKVIGAQGTLTEVYLENGVLTIVVKNTYVGTANVSGSNLNITPKMNIGTEWTAGTKNTNYTLDNDVLGIGNGAIILFNVDEGAPANVVAAKYATAVNNRFESASDDNANGTLEDGEVANVTMGDKEFKFNVNAIFVTGAYINEITLKGTVGVKCNYWMDAFGNIIYMNTVADAKVPYEFAYVLAGRELPGSWTTEDGVDASEYEAKLLLTTGDIKTVKVANADIASLVGQLFAYDVKNDVYTLYKPQVEDNTATAIKDGRGTNQAANYWALEDASSALLVDNSTAIVLKDLATGEAYSFGTAHDKVADTHELIINDNTVFIIEEAAGVYKTYTGVAKIPAKNTNKIAVVFEHVTAKTDRTYDVAKYVYVLDTTAVETPAGVGIIAKTNADKQITANVNGVAVVTFEVKAVLDGKVVTLTVTEEVYNALTLGVNYFKGLMYTNNVVDAVDVIDPAVTDDIYRDYEIDAAYNAGVVLGKLDGANCSKYVPVNVPAYVYDNSDKTVKVTTINSLTKDFAGFAVVDTDGNFILLMGADA